MACAHSWPLAAPPPTAPSSGLSAFRPQNDLAVINTTFFGEFKRAFNKKYSAADELPRLRNFAASLRRIVAINANDSKGWWVRGTDSQSAPGLPLRCWPIAGGDSKQPSRSTTPL
jgi:hypothetical protein